MANEQVLSLLLQVKNDTAAGFAEMQSSIKKLQDDVNGLSTAQKTNAGASDAMAAGQAKAKDALTAATASASQLASVLQGDLRTATQNAAAEAYHTGEALDSQIATLKDSQSAWDKYQLSLRDVNQSVTALGGNLRTNLRDALAQATSEMLDTGKIASDTAAELNKAQAELLKYEEAEKKASASTVQAASDATGALMRETDAAIKAAEALKVKSQSVLVSVAAEEDALVTGSAAEAGALDGVTAASLRQERALLRLGGQTAGIRQGFALAGVGLGGWAAILGGAAVYSAVKFSSEMQKVQGNTGATTAQMNLMEQQVLSLGSKGPASLDDIATAFRHVSDEGYRGKDAVTVVDEAWKSAIATHGKVADIANALATVLGNQHEPAAQAAHDMDVITTAAQSGNMTLENFATNYSKVGVVMAAIHQPLTDGAAAFATLSRATADPSKAATYEQNMLLHIINPTKAATTEMETLKKATGIDLAQAFQQFAQGQISLQQVLDLSKQALGDNIGATEKLFGGLRGGQGAVVLMDNHWQDYNKILGTVSQSNKAVESSFTKAMDTTSAKLGTTKNDIIELGQSVGKDLLPDLNQASDAVGTLAKGLKEVNDETGGMVSDFLKISLGVYGVVKAVKALNLAWEEVKASEIASNPVGWLVGAAVAGGEAGKQLKIQEVGSENKIDAGATKQEQQYLDSLAAKWAEGKGSLQAYWAEYNLGVKEGIKNLTAFNYIQLQVMKADAQYTPKSEMLAALANAPKGKGDPGFTPAFDIQAAIKNAATMIDNWAAQAAADGKKYGEHSAQVEFDTRMLDKWKLQSVTLTDQWNALIDTSTVLANANKAAAAPILAQARNLEAFGKAIQSSISTIKAYDAAGVSAAKDIKSFATQQTQGDMAAITRSVPGTTIPYLSGTPAPSLYANSRPYGGTPQYDPTVLSHGTAASAEALSPDDRAAMAHLSNSIDQFPPEFQGAFTSVTQKLQDEEKKNYNEYIDKLNKENVRDAEARTRIQAAHDDAVAKANAKAQDSLQKENERYLAQLDQQETKHNQDLENHLASFNVAFESAMSTFEANMVADEQKAEAERQTHNDKLLADYATLQEQLAGVHGKNAAEQRQKDWDLYSKKIAADDAGYQGQVTAMDNHVKGQTNAFTHHVQSLKDTLDKSNANSDATLNRQKQHDAQVHGTRIGGITTTLGNSVSTADSNERLANTREAQSKSAADATAKAAYDKANTTILGNIVKASTNQAMLADLNNKASNGYDKALADSEIYILKHGHASEKASIALSNAIDMQDKLTAAQQKALNNAVDNSTVPNLPGANFGKVGTAAPGSPSIYTSVGGGGFAGTVGGVIAGGVALQDTFGKLVKAGDDAYAASEVQTHANYQIAVDTKDTATAFSILDQAFLAGKKSLDGMPVTLEGVVAAYNANQQTVLQSTQNLIAFDRATGNTADELTQTQTLYHQGNASLADLTQAYNDNAAAVAKTTQQDLAFYMATGQFGQALSSLTTQIGQGVTDSQAKVTLDVYSGNTSALQADTQAAIDHRKAQEALTNATWDATYATANAATQSQMRQSLVSPIVSQQSTIQGLDSAVFNAKLSVIAAQSAVQVQELQAEVTATNDLAGIITAQAGVAKAQGDKQLARLNDMIPVMNDNNAIMLDLQSGDQQQLQIDKEQLLIDKTTAAMDQAVANFQITIAQDQLKQAQDKMMVDQANAQAAFTVAMDNLQLAQDNVSLAEAQQQLGIDQLTVLNNIDTTLGSVTDYLNLIDGDLQALQQAQDNIQTDQSNLATDTSNQNIIGQQGQLTLSGDALGLAGDQAGMQQAQQAYELQIAQYKVQLNSYQLQQKDSQTNGQSTAALEAMVKVLQQMITNIHSPAGRAVIGAGVGANNLAALQNSFSSTVLPMGFS